MSKIIAIANQKGGVGKTTSTRNLAHALKEAGHRVLLIDADPQGSLSLVTGIDGEELVALDDAGKTIYYALTGKTPIGNMIVHKGGLDIVPATLSLADVERDLKSPYGVAGILRALLDPLRASYDAILIDCAPTTRIDACQPLGGRRCRPDPVQNGLPVRPWHRQPSENDRGSTPQYQSEPRIDRRLADDVHGQCEARHRASRKAP
jgi:MinD-like ATPase involved in chromosome partitioning or flagellar assembly